MPMPFGVALVAGLMVRFGGGEMWTQRPSAKVVVVARGPICDEYLDQHVEEVRASVSSMICSHPRLDESVADVAVEIKRMMHADDMEVSISTSVIMAMTAGATTAMY